MNKNEKLSQFIGEDFEILDCSIDEMLRDNNVNANENGVINVAFCH